MPRLKNSNLSSPSQFKLQILPFVELAHVSVYYYFAFFFSTQIALYSPGNRSFRLKVRFQSFLGGRDSARGGRNLAFGSLRVWFTFVFAPYYGCCRHVPSAAEEQYRYDRFQPSRMRALRCYQISAQKSYQTVFRAGRPGRVLMYLPRR